MKKKSNASRFVVIISMLVNFVLVVALVACVVLYADQNQNKSKEQNINNITAISQSKSVMAETILDTYSLSIESIYNYCNGKSLGDALNYVDMVYGSSGEEYQLVRCIDRTITNIKYLGFSSKKINDDFIDTVDYQSAAHPLLVDMFEKATNYGKAQYSCVFTNPVNGVKSFAPFTAITLTEGGIENRYILLNPHTSSSLMNSIAVPSQYSEVATAIFDPQGSYLAYDPGYKSLDFYDYIYTYNGLSLNEMNALRDSVLSNPNDSGILNYKNAKTTPCTFIYSKFTAISDWYVVVCVKNTDFVSSKVFDTYPLVIILCLAALLIYDSLLLLTIIRKLRLSVVNEKIANSAKTDFLARMSHDIRTPMNGIMGLTDLTLEIKDLPEEAVQNLKSIASSNRYLVSLINDILDMNVISAGKMELHNESTDIETLMDSIIQLSHSSVIDKSLSFSSIKKLDYSENVLCDKVRVKQIFMNILSNAIKYTDNGGRVEFNYFCEKKEHDRLYYTFITKDMGVGMSSEFVKKIFEPFAREHNSMTSKYVGTGLGMSIVKTLVDLMGGTIDIVSQKEVGTEVTIKLDFAIAPADAGNTATAAITNFDVLRDKNVLLVDDHPINIAIARKMLEAHGVIVDMATNGEEAISKFEQSESNHYDAILMDVKMPVMDGIEATKRIRKLGRVDAQIVPIIAMTANAFAEDIVSTKNAGMNAHLAKPIEKLALLQELSKHINRSINNE